MKITKNCSIKHMHLSYAEDLEPLQLCLNFQFIFFYYTGNMLRHDILIFEVKTYKKIN